jgi:hypothetical protein
MDDFDFVEHLADTANAVCVSRETIDAFIRSYYSDLLAVATKWHGFDSHDEMRRREAWAELNAAFEKYWLVGTRFAEHWQPAMFEQSEFEIAQDSGVAVYMDMLGNFVAKVRGERDTSGYLLSVIHDAFKIVNRFFG